MASLRRSINIDLTVEDGEFFSLLGPSGSGKTTCLKVIAGFEAPDQGEVSIFDQDCHKHTPIQKTGEYGISRLCSIPSYECASKCWL